MPRVVLCCVVLCRVALSSNVSCLVELRRALLHCGSSRPWRPTPARTDMDLELELPERIARARCSRNVRVARPPSSSPPPPSSSSASPSSSSSSSSSASAASSSSAATASSSSSSASSP
eukprot:2130139-Pyramimonas_sp.AAC.1